MSSLPVRWVVCLLFCLQAACAKHATEKVLETTLRVTEANQKQIADLLTSEDFRRAARELSAELAGGAVDGLTQEARLQRLTLKADQFIRALEPTLSAALANSVEGELGPALRAELRRGVVEVLRTAIAEGTSGTSQERLGSLAEALTVRISDSLLPRLGPEAGRALREDLLPAFDEAFRRGSMDLSGATASGVPPHSIGRVVTREAMLGLADALNGDLGLALDGRAKAWQERLDQSSRFWERIAWIFIALSVGGGSVLTWLVYQRQRKLLLLEKSLKMVMHAIKQHDQEPGVRAAVAQIRQLGQERQEGLELKRILHNNPALKVSLTTTSSQTVSSDRT
jgi:hypothetical protein